jgi:pyridinium-3,5-bisthiocarboxylic acid mononucleotide nickel chelatase
MKTLYLDIFSGLSGDMFVGALLDLGVDFHQLQSELAKLRVGGYHLHSARKAKASIEGVKFDVHLHEHHSHGADHSHSEHGHSAHDHSAKDHESHHEHQHDHEHGHSHHSPSDHAHSHTDAHEHHEHDDSRDYADIKNLIGNSALSAWVKEKSLAVFHRIAVAEGKIHGVRPEEVHFHEVGAVDSIVDIVGACIGLEMLGKPRVLSGTVVDGTGWVQCAHGRFPIPTAATLEILGARGIPITQCEESHELVTPTGAALLAEFAETFGPMRQLIADRVGYGLGTRDLQSRPNVVRAVLGRIAGAEVAPSSLDWEVDTVCVIEANIDDANPELLGHLFELTLARGALDLFFTPVQMKKNRPGVLLTLLCKAEAADQFSELLLRETSSFGIRRYSAERRKLRREFKTVLTQVGEVTVKLGLLNGKVLHATPEFESCRKLALEHNLPLKAIYDLVAKHLHEL